jgi:uncharacterized membrane protein YfcA
MLLGVPSGEIAWLAAAIAGAGVIVGLLAGLFGIGGGVVTVPVLYEAFGLFGVSGDVRMQLCVGTSLAIIVPTAIRSYRAHRARGTVLPQVLRVWRAPAVVGVAIGAVAAAFAPAGLFKIVFALVAGVIAAKLLFFGDRWRLGKALPGRAAMTGYGFLIGLLSSLMGISGGSLVTMVLTLYGKPIHKAVATAAGLGVPIATAGAIGYVLAGLSNRAELPPLSLGFVSAIGLVLMAPISSWAAPLGARLAHALPRRGLEIAFGLFLLAASLRFVASLAG